MTIQAIDRAIDIISLFSIGRPRLGITDISKCLGLNKTTVHGLVRTLTNRGFLRQDPETSKYCLGMKIYELGTILAGSMTINQEGIQQARRLTESTGLTIGLAIWEEGTVMSTLRLLPQFQPVESYQLVPRIPAYCTSLGKAILAWISREELDTYLKHTRLISYTPNTITSIGRLKQDLELTRKRGYSLDRQEFVTGIACTGAPIFDHTKRAVAAISISGTSDQVLRDKKRLEQMQGELVRTATDISHNMGYLPEIMVERR